MLLYTISITQYAPSPIVVGYNMLLIFPVQSSIITLMLFESIYDLRAYMMVTVGLKVYSLFVWLLCVAESELQMFNPGAIQFNGELLAV